VPAQTIARERLFERLRDGRGRRLSLIACPAGFGKSTLLAAWRESEARAARGVGDAGRGRQRCGRALVARIEALCRACPGLAYETLAALAASAPVLEVVLPRLVNALVEQPELLLVLDDFHRLSSHSTRASVAWFIEHLPSTVQLVLASRTDPALPLGTLRARGQLLELRADDLRFTTEEASEFLNGRLELDLAAADVDLLVTRTEGWPAGRRLPGGALTVGHGRQARAGAGVRRHEHACRRLPGERGARRA
jgi:LuxR family maltose regulon positive regulatory protein